MISISIQIRGTELGDSDKDIVIDEFRDGMEELIGNFIEEQLATDMAQMSGLPLVSLTVNEITVEKA